MDAKTLFLEDKELSDWFRAIMNDSRFKKAVAFADSQMCSRPGINGEHLQGMKWFKDTLFDLAEIPSDTKFVMPATGMKHNLDVPRRTRKPTEKDQSNAPKNT